MWRRIIASILVVVGAVLLLLASFGWWADRYFLNSGRFADKANQILDQEEVQDALAVAITDRLSERSGRDLRIARPFITTIVREVVGSDAFQTVFDAAVLRTHHAIVEGGARDAVLNLSRIVDDVKDALEPIAPNLADRIPEGEKVQVKILDKTQLDAIYDITNVVENLVVVVTILAVLFIAGGVALSNRRWRTLALAGWVTLGLFVFSLVAVMTGRIVTGSLIADEDYSDAARAAYKVITRGLIVQAIVIGIIGLVVAIIAGWIDRNGGWAAARDAMSRGATWVRAQVPKRAAPAPGEAVVGDPTTGAVAVASLDEGGAEQVEPVAPAQPAGAPAGLLATRLPEPPRRKRTAHWWRAAGLLVLGLFAVFSPGSLTSVVVIILGLIAIYLAITEALAAWASPKEPRAVAESPPDGA
jgi:hypothetical protein